MEVSPLIGNAYTRNSNMGSKFTPTYGSRDIGCLHDATFPIIIENSKKNFKTVRDRHVIPLDY